MPSSHVAEVYLRLILELEEDGVPALRARIAERSASSLPLVCQNIARLQRHGLLRIGPDRCVLLTRAGRREAVAALRKHRLAELLLLRVIGLPPEQAHREAARWVYALSERAEQHIHVRLGRPRLSAHGRPIPGLKRLPRPG